MSEERPRQITETHLARLAAGYSRQSTEIQVKENTGSGDHQAGQLAHARRWGWPDTAILLIKDEGLSGAGTAHRPGWQRLVRLIVEDQVGLILVSDISRLSRDRGDFHTLVSLCRDHDVLLVVEGTIVNFDDPHDRFMANIRADVAEYDRWIRRETMMKGAQAKARRGHAVRRPPTGYQEEEKGRWVKDADPAVREAIERVFRDFQRLGTIGRVLREYRAHDIKLPVRVKGKLKWVSAYRQRLYSWLTNIANAGSYVYGRRATVRGKTRRRPNPAEIIVVHGHHEPYVAREVWDQIQAQLRGNRLVVTQPVGIGGALCQGRLTCGHCQHRMYPQYHRRKADVGHRYVCTYDRLYVGAAPCWSISGRVVDALVTAELLRCFHPPDVEAVIAAAADVNAAYDAVVTQRDAERAQAQYQADVARRRFERVDPANRRVAAALERDWNLQLDALHALELRQAESRPEPPLVPTPEVVRAIHEVAQDFPALWAAPSTTHEDRKALFRLFVTEVVLAARTDVHFEIEIRWVGGAVTRHIGWQPNGFSHLAVQLHAAGQTEAQIVAEAGRRGMVTAREGRPYALDDVRAVLRRAARKGQPRERPPWAEYRESLRAPLTELVDAGLSDRAIAEAFNGRRIVTFLPGQHWDKDKIRNVRTDLGLPSGRAAYSRRAPLRDLVERLVADGLTDAAIAATFNERGVRGFLVVPPWTGGMVTDLRHRLGIIRRPCPRTTTDPGSSEHKAAA